MIEKSIYDYLKTEQDIGVYLERPKNPPERYYLIEKTSGGMTNHVMNSTIIVQSYARSLYEAADMNESIIELMLEAVSLVDISRVSLNSNYNYTDPNTKQYRYQAVFDITHY